jgi:flagellar biosynthesis protein FlhF
VLKTREVVDPITGTKIEVTACLEKATVGRAAVTLASEDRVNRTAPVVKEQPRVQPQPEATIPPSAKVKPQTNEIEERLTRLEQLLVQLLKNNVETANDTREGSLKAITDRLRLADVPAEFIDSLLPEIADVESDKFDDTVIRLLVGKLATRMIPDLKIEKGQRVLVVGPAGNGKSSVLGKLATHLVVREKKKVELLSLDDIKIGAFEEIMSYADLLKIDVTSFKDFSRAAKAADDRITLIDSPAMPRDKKQLVKLQAKIETLKPDVTIGVFSALTRAEDMLIFAGNARKLGVTHLAVTMTDLTERHGSIIAAMLSTGCKLAYVSDAPGGMGQLVVPDPDKLSRSLMQAEVPRD